MQEKSRTAGMPIKQEQAAAAETLKPHGESVLEVETRSNQEITRLEAELEKIGQAEYVATSELGQLAEEKLGLEAKLVDAAAQIKAIEERSGSSNEELLELNARLQSLRAESAAQSKELGIRVSAHAVKQERRSSMETDLRRLAAELEDARSTEVNRSECPGNGDRS
jgi:chromosome segregation ATPase